MRLVVVALALGLSLQAAALAFGSVAAGSAKVLPSVRIFALSPVQVRGAHFVSGEHVRLTLHAGTKTFGRTAFASSVGAFVVGFGKLSSTDRCSGSISVSARGAHHDGATYKLPTLACPTAPSAGASTTPSVSYG
jgi:hypothetical protein